MAARRNVAAAAIKSGRKSAENQSEIDNGGVMTGEMAWRRRATMATLRHGRRRTGSAGMRVRIDDGAASVKAYRKTLALLRLFCARCARARLRTPRHQCAHTMRTLRISRALWRMAISLRSRVVGARARAQAA